MADYTYLRGLINGAYNIENPNRLDAGNQIRLSKEIETALPGKNFTLHCNGTATKIVFQEILSVAEETILDTTVSDHKNNT